MFYAQLEILQAILPTVLHAWNPNTNLTEGHLGCLHTNRVESSPIQSSQTLESRGFTPTESSPSLREFQWVFSTLWTLNILRTLKLWKILTCLFCTRLCGEGGGVVREGTCGCTRYTLRDQIAKYLATCIRICSRMKRNSMGFFRTNNEQFHRLVTAGGRGNTKTKHQL